jgi:8-oxo-dGTP pyrophosphatase MutT (NUDIX family)
MSLPPLGAGDTVLLGRCSSSAIPFIAMQKLTETAAGGVLYRRGASGFEVVIGEQTDRRTGARTHRLPKGKIGKRETLEAAALREVREETGLSARIVGSLGSVEYAYRDGEAEVAKAVHFYLMELEPGAAQAPDGELEQLAWFPLDQAARILTFDTERRMVERASAELAPGRR